MNIAFLVYPGMTGLDLVGFLDPVVRLRTMGFMPELSYDICSLCDSIIEDDHGLRFAADKVNEPINDYDLVFMPGTYYVSKIKNDQNLIAWIKTARQIPFKVSVCTGGLLFGKAGFLRGLRATTHPNSLLELESYCATVVRERVVDEGNVITAGGVTSAIDAGLHVVRRLAGDDVHNKIAIQMDYRTPYLAFKAGEKRFDSMLDHQ
tara:strand:+ start:983 stop:1600 length:618 start_codon:yes stop_codon:yes gene_type:complete